MREIPIAATGMLLEFAKAHMIDLADFHLARRVAQMSKEAEPRVELAFALTVRALRTGSVCLNLATAHQLPSLTEVDDGQHEATDLPWPEPDAWAAALQASPAVTTDPPADAAQASSIPPFTFIDSRLYLSRYFLEERAIRTALERRAQLPTVKPSTAALQVAYAPDAYGSAPDPSQQEAIRLASSHATCLITGGPGTGKTTTAARLLDALAHDARDDRAPLVALVAPTGKAASRLATAVQASATGKLRLSGPLTLHALLGASPNRASRTHHRDNPVPYDVVVLDETSMVSLSMMSWLLDAVAPATRLIMLGDPHQLAPVEEGNVLADFTQLGEILPMATLTGRFRNNPEIAAIADAVLAGDAPTALHLIDQAETVSLQPYTGTLNLDQLPSLTERLAATAERVLAAAKTGDGETALQQLSTHRILCAHRTGSYGVNRWTRAARAWLATHVPGYAADQDRWVGQPLLMTRNTDIVANGDTAVVVQQGERLIAAVQQATGVRYVDPTVLDHAEDLHAMTIHKSQGSQFGAVSIVLPPVGSPLLTRELIYTAITRAQHNVEIYGTAEALTAAITTVTRRDSGLSVNP